MIDISNSGQSGCSQCGSDYVYRTQIEMWYIWYHCANCGLLDKIDWQQYRQLKRKANRVAT